MTLGFTHNTNKSKTHTICVNYRLLDPVASFSFFKLHFKNSFINMSMLIY